MLVFAFIQTIMQAVKVKYVVLQMIIQFYAPIVYT